MTIKERLLAGKNLRKVVTVKIGAEEVGVTIRPLADYEQTILQGMVLSGLDMQIDMEKLNVEGDMGQQFMRSLGDKVSTSQIAKIFRESAEGNMQICAWCIVDEYGKSVFSLDEVKCFVGGTSTQIANAVRELSGVGEEAQVKRFHQKSNRD